MFFIGQEDLAFENVLSLHKKNRPFFQVQFFWQGEIHATQTGLGRHGATALPHPLKKISLRLVM
ncbi:MAG: hypothetical protein D6794_04150 [Deltaproteobacteria bacterium]|nr:MAG: hypothetical protein D6794_04150 [Deltaproteobacteria bacterium]